MQEIQDTLIKGRDQELKGLVEARLEQAVPAVEILNEGLLKGMNEVGIRFKNGDFYLPEVLLAARAMKCAMEVLGPRLAAGEVGTKGTVVLGTVRGDLHDIGKNLVRIMLEGNGYKVVDLGSDVPPERFVDEAIAHQACAIAMSALLTTTMGSMAETVKILQERGSAETIRVLVGGAPVTRDYCKEIGADGYGASAPEGVEVLDAFLDQG
ncbi:MAG: corrinoid protein [Planctomycetota bacterium]|jgi:5-methyltetrahydrofolate--homocysteine methyltransferase